MDEKYKYNISKLDLDYRSDEDDYFENAREAYASAMEQLRDLPQQLAAKGLTGGVSAAAARAVAADYRNTMSALKSARLLDEGEHRAGVARQNELWRGDINELRLRYETEDEAEAKAQKSASGSRRASSGGSVSIGAQKQEEQQPNKIDYPREDMLYTVDEMLNYLLTNNLVMHGGTSAGNHTSNYLY